MVEWEQRQRAQSAYEHYRQGERAEPPKTLTPTPTPTGPPDIGETPSPTADTAHATRNIDSHRYNYYASKTPAA